MSDAPQTYARSRGVWKIPQWRVEVAGEEGTRQKLEYWNSHTYLAVSFMHLAAPLRGCGYRF